MPVDFVSHYMGIACGVLRLPPRDFWQATPLEITMAYHGFEIFHGLKDGFSDDDARYLRALLDEKNKV